MPKNFPQLYYLTNDRSELLPEWAYFFLQLGYQLATISNDSYRYVIGLAIPTRAFACSLVAAGIAFSRVSTKNVARDTQSQHILSLEPGTSVHVRGSNNKKLRGVVDRFEERYGKPYIFIRTTTSETRGFPVHDYASRITVSSREVRLPKNQQTGHSVETASKFLECCLGKKLAQRYTLDSSFEALLIGKKSIIHQEVCNTLLVCKTHSESTATRGHLQEILRVRQFSGANKSYLIQCVSLSNLTPENEIGTQVPPIVVFDGAIAYIKLGPKWRSAHQVVLLDRTESQFNEAAELLNQNYTYRLIGSFKFPINVPDGIEMMVYRDSIK